MPLSGNRSSSSAVIRVRVSANAPPTPSAYRPTSLYVSVAPRRAARGCSVADARKLLSGAALHRLPSARSGRIVGDGQVGFMRAAEGGTDALDPFVGGQQPCRLGDAALAVDPLG